MRYLLKSLLLGLILMFFCVNAKAEEYTVALIQDQMTIDDLTLIDNFVKSSQDGDPVPKQLRRLVMAAVGETQILLKTKVDDFGNLTLDDGTSVPLYEGDTVSVMEQTNACGPSITYEANPHYPGAASRTSPVIPRSIIIYEPGPEGSRCVQIREMDIPPTGTRRN